MTEISDFIRENSGHFTVEELAGMTSGKTEGEIRREISALLESKRIAADSTGKVGWIYNPKLCEQYESKPRLRVR